MSNVDLSLISTTVIEDSWCSLEENLRQELAADKIESLLHFFSSMRQSRASHDWSRSSSERRKLTTLQVPSEGMSGTRVHPLQYWYEDSDELEQVRQNETTAHSGVGKNSGSGKISFHQN